MSSEFIGATLSSKSSDKVRENKLDDGLKVVFFNWLTKLVHQFFDLNFDV